MWTAMPSLKCYFDTSIHFHHVSDNFGFVMFSWPLGMLSTASLTTTFEKLCIVCFFITLFPAIITKLSSLQVHFIFHLTS